MSDTFGVFTFSGSNKVISLSLGTVSFSAGELYSRWKQWTASSDNAKYPTAFSGSVGGEALGGGVTVGAYFFIENGWTIRPQEANHQLLLSGNLFPIPSSAAIFTATLSQFQVVVGMRTSSLTQQVLSSSGSGGASAADVATAVWEKDISAATAGAGKDLGDTKKTTAATLGLL